MRRLGFSMELRFLVKIGLFWDKECLFICWNDYHMDIRYALRVWAVGSDVKLGKIFLILQILGYAILFVILCTNCLPNIQVHRSNSSRDMAILVFRVRHLQNIKKHIFIQFCNVLNHFGSLESTKENIHYWLVNPSIVVKTYVTGP